MIKKRNEEVIRLLDRYNALRSTALAYGVDEYLVPEYNICKTPRKAVHSALRLTPFILLLGFGAWLMDWTYCPKLSWYSVIGGVCILAAGCVIAYGIGSFLVGLADVFCFFREPANWTLLPLYNQKKSIQKLNAGIKRLEIICSRGEQERQAAESFLPRFEKVGRLATEALGWTCEIVRRASGWYISITPPEGAHTRPARFSLSDSGYHALIWEIITELHLKYLDDNKESILKDFEDNINNTDNLSTLLRQINASSPMA